MKNLTVMIHVLTHWRANERTSGMNPRCCFEHISKVPPTSIIFLVV